MKASLLVGIALIVLGVISLVYQGFTYTTREKKVDLGPIEIVDEHRNTIPLPPILGGLALVGGVALVAVGSRK
jgi:uncharacterized membrane protein